MTLSEVSTVATYDFIVTANDNVVVSATPANESRYVAVCRTHAVWTGVGLSGYRCAPVTVLLSKTPALCHLNKVTLAVQLQYSACTQYMWWKIGTVAMK
jgi:hypothetical protein